MTAALVYAVLALGFVSPALVPGKTLSTSDALWFTAPWQSSTPADLQRPANTELGDPWKVYHPFLQRFRQELPKVPLWNPYIMAGRPFGESAVFSPFSLPAYVLPFWSSLALIAALKLFVAAFGTFLLARSLRIGGWGALLAGVVFAFCLYQVVWLSITTTSVWVFIPWILWLTDMVVRRPEPLATAGLAAVVGIQLISGHSPSSFHTLVAAALFFVLRLLSTRRSRAPTPADLRRRIVAFGLAVGLGVALAAAVLLPVLELIRNSTEVGQRGDVGSKFPARWLVTMLLPDYWGRGTRNVLAAYGFLPIGRYLYAGALPLMLALAGLILRPRTDRVAIAAYGVICMAVVVGVTPVFEIVTALPGFASTDNTRLSIYWMLAVALLAGWGLEELRAGGHPRWRVAVVLGLSGALLCVPVAIAWAPDYLWRALGAAWGIASYPVAADGVRMTSLVLWVTMAGVGVALLALRSRGVLRASAFCVLAVALVTFDLFRTGVGLNPAIPLDHARQPTTGAIRYLQSQRPARFVGVGQALRPDLSVRYGLYDARGYDFPVETRYQKLWDRDVAPLLVRIFRGDAALIEKSYPVVDSRSLRVLGLLGVTDVVQAPSAPALEDADLRPVYQGTDATVYANRRALPRAWVAAAQWVVGTEAAALAAVGERGFDGRRAVVTERALPGIPVVSDGAPAGSARILSYEPQRVAIRAQSRGRGVLVLSDVHYPGWEATVDGRKAPVERVDYLLRGVVVPPGTHQVVFSYVPSSWRVGWIISLVAMVAVGALALTGWRRRRAV